MPSTHGTRPSRRRLQQMGPQEGSKCGWADKSSRPRRPRAWNPNSACMPHLGGRRGRQGWPPPLRRSCRRGWSPSPAGRPAWAPARRWSRRRTQRRQQAPGRAKASKRRYARPGYSCAGVHDEREALALHRDHQGRQYRSPQPQQGREGQHWGGPAGAGSSRAEVCAGSVPRQSGLHTALCTGRRSAAYTAPAGGLSSITCRGGAESATLLVPCPAFGGNASRLVWI